MFLSIGSVIFALILIFLLYKRFLDKSLSETKLQKTENESQEVEETKNTKTEKPNKKIPKPDLKKRTTPTFSHPWLSTVLKGHTGNVQDFDFSANGKFLVSCCNDRSILLWHTNEFENKEHKTARRNLDFDNAYKICAAPDSKSILTCLQHDNRIIVSKVAKKDNGQSKIVEVEGVEFKSDSHKLDIIDIAISCNGKFFISASSDTTIIVWDLKGNVLKILDTKQGNNYKAKVSPCGRFVACSGFTPDVKVWEVTFSRNGDFQDVVRAFELKGHSSGVRGFDFNQDSTRMVSASKDGTFRVYNTDIKYTLGQDPYLLVQKPLDDLKKADFVSVAMTPNSDVIAIVTDKLIRFFCSETGAQIGLIRDCESINTAYPFSAGAKFTSDSRFLAVARERQILVFHNVPGFKVLARKAADQVAKANSAAHKERLQQQADEAQKIFDTFPCE